MQKFLNYEGLQSLVERIKSCYLLEIGVSGGAWAIMVDSTADRAEINAIVEGNAPMPIAVKLHMADNDTDYIVNTCQVRGGYFMLYIPDDMVLTDMDGTEFTGTWMKFMADSFTPAVDYYATSVDLRNSTQVITDTSKATSSNVLYLVADSSRNVSGVVYNSKTYTFAAEKGEKGDKGDTGATGVGITSVKQTVASMISGDTNVVEITTSDGKTSQVKIRNGNASTSGTEIVQTTGTATDKVMSQKSVTDALQNKLDKASIVQSTGSATDKVMSQAAVTDYVTDYCATLRSYTPNEAWKVVAFNVSNLARTRNTYSTAAKPCVFVRSTAASSSYIPNTFAFAVSTVAISLDEHTTNNIIKAVTDGMVLYNNNGYWHLVVKRSDSQVLDHQFATRLASGFNWAVLLDYRASKLTFKATNTAGSALLEESVDLSSLDIDFGDVYYLAGLGANGIVPDVIFCYNDLYVTIDSYTDPLTCGNYKIAGISSVSDTTGANLTDGLNTTAMDAIYTTHSYDSDTGAYTGSLSSDSYTANSVLQVKDAIAKFNSDDTVWHVKLKVTGSMTIKASSSYINNWIIKDLTAGTEEIVSSVTADHVLTDGHEYEFIYKAGWYSGNWFFAKGDFTAVWSGLQWLSILHTDLTPSNYDGKMIKGNIDFYYNNPTGVITVPQVIVGTSNPWDVVGTQRVDTSGNIYYKVKSGTSLIEKKINNT